MSNNEIIHLFLNPKSVAIIGASKNPMKGGNWIVNNLTSNNFKGEIYPINPNSEGQIYGLDIKKSVLDIDKKVDLAIFYVPNWVIPSILEECIEKGIKGAIIETSGFEEVGDKGLELRDQILKITDNFKKIRIVGPNCMGITRIDNNSNSEERGGFFSGFGVFNNYKRGNIAIISQSGMLNGGYLMHIMEKYPDIGFRYSCAIGNKMDLSELEFLEYFINDSTVNVIAIYLESFKDPRKFIELCRKAKKIPNKTIILAKGGLTPQGQKATLSHTGSIAENLQLIEAIIKQSGIIRAHSFYELFQFARTFSMMYNTGKELPRKGNVTTIVGSGGAGTIIADLLMHYGLNLPLFGDKAYRALEEIFPTWMPPNRFSLIDIWPAMEKAMKNKIDRAELLKLVYDAVLGEPDIEGFFNMIFCSKRFRRDWNVDELIENAIQISKPIFFWLIGEAEEVQYISQLLAKNNIPSFTNLEEMVKNFWILVQESKNRKQEDRF
ncbi:MAG: CoA-binding protein [Candidatus Hodarchaeota archaeon]